MFFSTYSVHLLSELSSFGSFPDGVTVFVAGILTNGDTVPHPYIFKADSMLIHDGFNVVRPTSIAVENPGRWVRYGFDNLRVEIFTGTTDASGNISMTYSSAFDSIPFVDAVLQSGTHNQTIRLTNTSVSACTFNVQQRNTVTLLGVEVLLSTLANVSGAAVKIIAIQKV